MGFIRNLSGYPLWKALKLLEIFYTSTGSIAFYIEVDGGVQFFSTTLPTQSTRAVQRILLPSMNGGVLNKSKTYRMLFVANSGNFKFYSDACRMEFLAFGAPRHRALQQKSFSEITAPVVP